MRKVLTKLASSTSPTSLASWFRKRRFKLFRKLVSTIPKRSVEILDIGGWEEFWEIQQFAATGHSITLLNTYHVPTKNANIRSVVGDARRLEGFADNSMDIVFSNSVIEHLGTFADQRKMANEVRRVGRAYFVQTPSFYFPIEPHFLFPCFHWLPRPWRIALIARFSLGFYLKRSSPEEAAKLVDEIRLLRRSEFQSLFPDARIYTERVFGVPKSYMAIRA